MAKLSSYATKTIAALADLIPIVSGGANKKITVGNLRDHINVLDYGAVGDGVTDDTSAFQAAIDAAASGKHTVVVPFSAANYLINGTLTLKAGVRLVGDSSRDTETTHVPKIQHAPTTPGDHLFELDAPSASGYCFGVDVDNLYLTGNANSGDGINLDTGAFVGVRNSTISGFVNGISILGCMQSRIEDCMIKSCSTAAINFLTGGTTTTVSVIRCNLRTSPYSALLGDDATLNTLFQDCIFESCTDGGVNANKGNTITILNCYSENIPSASAAKTLIKIGVDGTSARAAGNVSAVWVLGGRYAGFNGATPANSIFLECDDTFTACVFGADVQRFDKVLKTTVNTDRVELFGLSSISIGTTPFSTVYDPSCVLGGMYLARTGALVPAVLNANALNLYSSASKLWNIIATYSLTNPDLVFSVNGQSAIRMDTNKRLYAVGGLGVGNSAAATTPGSVTKKIEVFDASGNSLGFVPVYDAIT